MWWTMTDALALLYQKESMFSLDFASIREVKVYRYM
jgi:hypothetical protein